MAIASASNTCMRLVYYQFRYIALYSVLYLYNVYFITGTAEKVCRDVVGRDFVSFMVLFLITCVVCFIMRRAPMRDCVG